MSFFILHMKPIHAAHSSVSMLGSPYLWDFPHVPICDNMEKTWTIQSI